MAFARKVISLARCCDAGLLTLLALPLALLLVDPEWLYTGISKRDTWSYHAYFLDLPRHLRLHPHDYPSSRLTILLPGWLAYRWLPPAAADQVLHLGVYYAAVLGLYATLALTVGRRAALLTGVLIGTQGFVLSGAASNYIDGFGPAYFCLATACLARASAPGWRPAWLTLAGAAAAAVVVTNLVFLLLLPGLLAIYLVLARHGRWQGVARGLGWVTLGGVGLVAVLGLVNAGMGGRFFFLRSSLAFAKATVALPHDQKLPFAGWLPQAGYLVLPLAACAGALLLLHRWRRGADVSPIMACFQFQLLGLVALLGCLQLVPSLTLLQWWYYPVPLLLPAAALALGAQWGCLVDRLSAGGYVCLVAAAAGLALIGHHQVYDGRPLTVAACLAVATLGVVAAASCRGLVMGVAAAALLVVADWGVHCRFDPMDNLPRWVQELFPGRRCREFDRHRADLFHGVHGAMRLMNEAGAAGPCWVWYDPYEPLGQVFDRAACVHMCQTCLYLRPSADAEWTHPQSPGRAPIAVLSARADYYEQVIPRLAGYGLTASVVRRQRVGRGLPAFYVTILEPAALPGPTVRRSR